MYCWGAFLQPLFQWKSSEYYTTWVCICSRSNPACNAHAPYCHLWPSPLCKSFPHYLWDNVEISQHFTKLHKFRKKSYWTQNGFLFYLQLLSKVFLILRRNWRDMIKNVYRSSCKVPFILVRFSSHVNFLERIFKNPQILNFMKFRPVRAELFHTDGRKGRHDGAKSLFAILRTRRKRDHFYITLHNTDNQNSIEVKAKLSYCPLCYLKPGHTEKLKKIETWRSQIWEKNVTRFRSKEFIWIKVCKLHFTSSTQEIAQHGLSGKLFRCARIISLGNVWK
jgi:hypothetical protein